MPIPGVSELMNAKGKRRKVWMITVCNRCGKVLSKTKEDADDDAPDPMVSKGICAKCEKIIAEEQGL